MASPWTKEDDTKLAEIALHHIRQGGKLQDAFEEASQVLGRTISACRFRWSSRVKKDYMASFELAKEERKQSKKQPNDDQRPTYINPQEVYLTPLDFENGIRWLKRVRDAFCHMRNQIEEMNREIEEKEKIIKMLVRDKANLISENAKLKEKLDEIDQNQLRVYEDYKQMINIFRRSRDLIPECEEDLFDKRNQTEQE